MSYYEEKEKMKNSNIYHFRKYRQMLEDAPQSKSDWVEDFLFWLKYDYEPDEEMSEKMEEEWKQEIEKVINQFIGIDMEKVKLGELELLEKLKGE